MAVDISHPEWKQDCVKWRGEVLTGRYAHWCFDWDGLPVDETSLELMCCRCYYGKDDNPDDIAEFERVKQELRRTYEARMDRYVRRSASEPV